MRGMSKETGTSIARDPLPKVWLTGQLICATTAEAAAVKAYLPRHRELSRAEPGCLIFEVHQSDDPLVWQVEECFVDEEAFVAHQKRAAASEWGKVTAGIERNYSVATYGADES